MAYIYEILNKINGKIYIGSTNNLKRRISQHKYMLNKNIHHSINLQRSWNKYGEDNFEWIILRDDVEDIDRLTVEQFYLDKLNPFYPNGYNVSKNAECGGLCPGENHPKSTLTDNEVIEIKKMLAEGISQKEIVEDYGYTWGVIGKIASLSRWVNIGEEYNDKLKNNKRNKWEDWMMNELIVMRKNKKSWKDIELKTGISSSALMRRYEKYTAELEGRVKKCEVCGKEIIKKRKNSRKKYCDGCAKKQKRNNDRTRQYDEYNELKTV